METQYLSYKIVEVIKGRRTFSLNISRPDPRCPGCETINSLSIHSNHNGLVVFSKDTGWNIEAIRRLSSEWKSALLYALHMYFSKYTADNANPQELHPLPNQKTLNSQFSILN